MSSPSKIRREGRNAFFRGGVPADHNPYSHRSFHREHWFEGWAEAELEDRDRIAREAESEAEEDAKIEEFARLYNLAKDRGLIS